MYPQLNYKHGSEEPHVPETVVINSIRLIVGLISVLLTIVEFVSIYGQYKMDPFATKIVEKPTNDLKLPNFTICTPIIFNYSHAKLLGMPDNVLVELSNYLGPSNFLFKDVISSRATIEKEDNINNQNMVEPGEPKQLSSFTEEAYDNFVVPHKWQKNPIDLLKEAGFVCTDLIRSCDFVLFEKSSLNSTGSTSEKCCNYATSSVKMRFGKCFDFQIPKEKVYDPMIGILLLVDLHTELDATFIEKSADFDGLIVYLWSDSPLDAYQYFIPPGVYAQMTVRKSHITFHRDIPLSNKAPMPCYPEDSELKHLNGPYTMETCNLDCFHNEMIKQNGCECVFPNDFIHLKNQTIKCNLGGNLKIGQSRKCQGNISLLDQQKCEKKCLPRCLSDEYKASVTYSTFPPKTWIKDPRKLSIYPDIHRWSDNVLLLHLRYARMMFTSVEYVSTMTIHSFISNLGGILGVFTGLSLLSSVHLCLFFYSTLKRKLYAQKHQDNGKPRKKLSTDSIYTTNLEHVLSHIF